MVPELLVLAVEFHRTPLRFEHLTDPTRPLPDGFGGWLLESGVALAAGNIEATAATLGVSSQALREAFLFFVRQTLLLPGADHYRVLGLSRGCPAESVKRHYSLLVRLFHPDRMPGEDEHRIVLTARINAAYQTLRDADARSRYDRQFPPSLAGSPAAAERLDFFRPRDPIKPFARTQRPADRSGLRSRPIVLWVLACLGTGGLLFLALVEPDQPALRIDPQSAGGAAPAPAYLRQEGEYERPAHAEPTVGPDTAGDDLATARETSEAEAAAPPAKAAGKRANAPAGTSAAPPPAPARKLAEARSPALPKAEAPSTPAPEAVRPKPASPVSPRSLWPAADPERRPPAAAREAPRKPEPKKTPPSGAPKVAGPPPSKPRPSVPPPRATPSPGKKGPETSKPDRLGRARTPAGPKRRGKVAVPGARAAARVITRLQRSYTNGDVGGLTSLFTANAVVDNGAGHADIRQRYSAIFKRDRHRRISIFGLRWRLGPQQRLLGTGEIRLRGRASRDSQWRSKSGTIQFELVPWRGDYQISKMTQRLSSR